jgi:hypothetical protein
MFNKIEMWRDEDETGVSGIGKVAEGVRFSDGKIALRWLTSTSSTCLYDSYGDVLAIHGHGGKTRFIICGTPWKRGKEDAIQDAAENAPFNCIRGGRKAPPPIKRVEWTLPAWITKDEEEAYLAGYEAGCISLYGEEWETCSWEWHSTVSIGGITNVGQK